MMHSASSNGSAFRMAPVAVTVDNDKTATAALTMTRKQSLEALSSRVTDLLEGLDGAAECGERRQDAQQDVQRKFVQFRQKLETRLECPGDFASQALHPRTKNAMHEGSALGGGM